MDLGVAASSLVGVTARHSDNFPAAAIARNIFTINPDLVKKMMTFTCVNNPKSTVTIDLGLPFMTVTMPAQVAGHKAMDDHGLVEHEIINNNNGNLPLQF